MNMKLNLAEELLLLALSEEKGTVLMAASLGLPYGLAGALLIELSQAGLVRIEGKALIAAPRGTAGDELLAGHPSHERTAALISLVHACDMTGVIFEKGERREAKKRAKEISKSQPIGSAVARTIEAVRAAVIIAASS